MPLFPIEIILAVNGTLALAVIILGSLMMRLATRFRLAIGDTERQLSLLRPIILLLMLNLFLSLAAVAFNLFTAGQ